MDDTPRHARMQPGFPPPRRIPPHTGGAFALLHQPDDPGPPPAPPGSPARVHGWAWLLAWCALVVMLALTASLLLLGLVRILAEALAR